MSCRALEISIYLSDDTSLSSIARQLDAMPDVRRVLCATSTSSSLLDDCDVLRWTPGCEPTPTSHVAVLLGAEYTLLDDASIKAAYVRAHATSIPVHAEILSAEGAEVAVVRGATSLVACAFEGPGLVSEETGLVLLRTVLAATPHIPVTLRGGVGPESAAAAFAAGAHGVVLEHQLWACPEWPTSEKLQKTLERFDPTDTRSIGHSLGMRYRVFAQIATRPPKRMAEIEAGLLKSADHASARRELLATLSSHTATNPLAVDLKQELLPLGQCATLAAPLARQHESIKGIIQAVQQRAPHALRATVERFPFLKGEGAALTNHTDLPLHQGPMAQVSDTPAFARAVVDAGSMPWLALGNMPTEVAERIVWQTGEALQGKPFGAGIIGLNANRYRDGHIEMLGRAAKVFPAMMAIVAAGTAEQALQLESLGVRSYLHTPTPGVLRAALQNGQRLFLLEGTEAGGHIGQLGGLLLWQACINELNAAIESMHIDPATLTVLPAGGIGDAVSSAAIATMFQPLIARGVRVGLQMGTAYLMTHEAVQTGAINDIYQKIGRHAHRTIVLGESVGAPTRLLPNDAASRVAAREIERITEQVSLKDRKEAYEHDNLGGLRAAAKAQRIDRIDPEKGAIFASLTTAEQERDGLFHCGQGINLWRAPRPVASLHTEVTTGAHAFLTARLAELEAPVRSSQSTPLAPAPQAVPSRRGLGIAIVGVGAKVPGALTAPDFWRNIEQGVDAIKPVPADRWNPAEYFNEDRSAPDKTYSMVGGWVEGFVFDRKSFRLPPTVVQKMDPSQMLWLEAAREALADANLLDDQTWDRERCAVILGNAMGGDLRDYNDIRLLYPEVERGLKQAFAEHDISGDKLQAMLTTIEQRVKSQVTPITEDTMPGELGNVIAGRTAQLFDLGGPNFIVDAACASSLAAIEQAVRGLLAHRFDVALTGGVDCCMGPAPFIKFSKIGALSPDGSRPFDVDANGFVMGEGAAALILKRLDDAERDGDTIYGVIQGIGASSDGKGKAITAPNPIGQRRALKRAYEEAGFSLSSVSLIEAHGTSTPVGDPVEVGTLAEVLLEDDGVPSSEYVALGSVKSMIGHLKAAAGAASMLKVVMALHHKTLPPTLNVKTLNPALNLERTRIRLQHTAAPWRVNADATRRAGVSAFGFGGTNFHIALEEYVPASSRQLSAPSTPQHDSTPQDSPMSHTASANSTTTTWNEGIVAIAASSKEELGQKIQAMLDALATEKLDVVQDAMLNVSAPNAPIHQSGEHRIAVVFEKMEDLSGLLERAKKALQKGKGWRVLANQGVFSSYEGVADGKVAMLFPGQGSQYLGMLSGLAERYDVVRDTFGEADDIMRPALDINLSDLIHPDLEKVDQTDAFLALSQTEITQPAVLTVDVALLRLLDAFGIKPDVVAGHSLGEYGACVAAGVMTFAEALHTVALRGTQMANATPLNGDCGLMAAVPLGADEVQRELDALQPGYVVCANKNSPSQTIIAGRTEPMNRAVEHFESKGLQVMLLPVSHAFHSEVVAMASEPLREHMDSLDIRTPVTPILTNVTGGYYPQTSNEIRDLLAKQVAAPVEFMAMIEQMWHDGARIFIEVGPKRAQASFVKGILEGREHVSLFTNHPKKGDVRSWLDALAMLWLTGAWSQATATQSTSTTAPQATVSGVAREDVAQRLLDVLCEKTGYDADEIEFDYELEADLGIDTVKQAEIIAAVRDHYKMERDEDFRLAEFPTLNALTDYVISRLGASAPAQAASSAQAVNVQAVSTPSPQAVASGVAREDVAQRLLDVLCEKTGYDADEIEFDYELEADLGIDTVKQAEIIAAVRDHYKMERDEDFRLAEFPTLNALTDYVISRLGVAAPAQAASSTQAPVVSAPVASAPQTTVSGVAREDVAQRLLDVLCEKTGYDADEIEFDYELEADLGIDTVKQAEIIAAVRDHYKMERDEDFRLAEFPTLNALTDYVISRLGVAAPAQAASSAQAVNVQAVSTTALQATVSGVAREDVAQRLLDVLCEKTGYDADEIEFDYELEADLGIDTVKQAEIIAAVRDHYKMERDEDFRLAEFPTLNALTDYVISRLGDSEPPRPSAKASPVAATLDLDAQVAARESQAPAPVAAQASGNEREIMQHAVPAKVVVSGAAMGLPGSRELFADESLQDLLTGENMISDLSDEQRQAQVDNRIVRLVKHEDGSGEMVLVEHADEVVKLAGRPGVLNLAERWGVPDRLATAMDETSRMAFAAGIDALRDAGLPLIPRYRETRNGGKITIGWQLPEDIGAETGVIFASAFTGKDELINQVRAKYEDPEYKFDHRFLLKILGMANSRFAEYIGARGPNTHINVACSSTSAAMGMASDWIELGRCDRVVVIAADNAAGETLGEWIASGFLAAGAATTAARVEDGALPFDRRRHGMIVGSGAVGFIIERGGLPEERGIEPIADLLGVRFVNSAFHPTRLDVSHIAGEVEKLVSRVENDYDVSRREIAPNLLFVSHETFTPARGGSAAAEIDSLRHVFKDQSDEVVIANTKGFTGHPMAASLEDGLAVRALQYQQVPPIPNLLEPDPTLGNLRLSQGGHYPLNYALRFSAGFGSQFGVSMFRFRARQEDRLFSVRRQQQWIARVSGMDNPVLEVVQRTLRLRELQPGERAPGGGEEQEVASRAPYTLPTSVQVEAPVMAQPSQASMQQFAPRKVIPTPVELVESQTSLTGKRVALCGDPRTSSVVHAAIERLGAASVVSIKPEELGDEAALQARLVSVDAIVVSHGVLGTSRTHGADLDAVHQAARGIYHLGRAWQAALGHAPGEDRLWVTLTDMGGTLGLDEANQAQPWHGAIAGATKSLAREWEAARVCVVDLDITGGLDERAIMRAINVADDGARQGHVELGLRDADTIIKAAGQTVALDAAVTSSLDATSVVLLTGGAKGITASVAMDFARRHGCKLVLAGRTPMTFANPLAEDMKAHRDAAKKDLLARGERATPVALKRAVGGLTSQQEIARNMGAMQTLGAAHVEYVSCDLADAQAVGQMIDDVYARHGKLDVVVHGAGLEISRLLTEKDADEFDRVFCGKALGALAMWSAIEAREASTRPGLIAFSSIAGRFGNVGQIDYSAANEVCARLVSSVQRAGGRAMVLDWTAWADVGMASRGSMPEILTSRGVEFLPVEVGAQWPAMLWAQGASGEFLIAGSLGEMGGLEEVVQGKSEAIEGLPLVDRMTRHGARQIEVRRTLDVATDRFMRDHVYEGVPLMPGVMGLELMLEAAQALVGEDFGASDETLHIKDVKFERALKLHRGEPAEVIARATREPGEVDIRVEVLTRRTTKTGREVEQQHYTSSVLAMPELEVSSEPLTCNPTVGAWKRGPQRDEIYQRFFHERTFQVIDEIPAWCERAIIGYGRLGDESLVAGRDDRMMSSDPLAREAAFQVMGLWGMMCDELSYLPHSIERDVSFGRVVAGERFVVRGVKGESGKEGILRFDRIEVCDEAGVLLHIYEGVEMVGHQKLREDARFGAQFAAMWTSLRIDTVALDLWMGSRQVSDLINESELPEHSRLISERRRNEWLCARLATKELARCWARDFFGAAWALNDFVVRKDEFGAPSLAARDGLQAMGPLPFITMSHSHGVAYAVISAPGEPAPIGVDIERIEPREEAFARDYFTSEELALSAGEGVERDALITALWCCKESVSKALGLGLKLRMSDMIIERFAQDDVPGLVVKVTLRRDALEALHAQGSQGLEVRLFIESEFAVALARGVKREGLSRELDASQLTALAQILRQNGEALTARSTSPEGRTQGVMWRH